MARRTVREKIKRREVSKVKEEKTEQGASFDFLTELVNPVLWVMLLIVVAISGLIWSALLGGGL